MNTHLLQFAFQQLNELCEYLCYIDEDNEDAYAHLFTSVMQEMLVSKTFSSQIFEVLLNIKKVPNH